ATYWMFNNRLKDSVDECVSLFLSFLFGTVYMCIAACFMPVDISSWSGILAGMYIGGFEIGIPFICFGMAIRITSNPALINQMCYLSPFMSLFFIAVILGEPIMLTTYIGLFLIVAGIVYNQYFAVPSGKPKRQLS
ncbi:DMT family transporter, partial [uncultured Muribaculum sp.]